MKNIILFVCICLLSSFSCFSQSSSGLKVGILSNEELENFKEVGDAIEGELQKQSSNYAKIIRANYTTKTLIEKYDSLTNIEKVDIIVGPSESKSLSKINEYIKDNNIEDQPFFISPTVSSTKDNFDKIKDFMSLTPTNDIRIKVINDKILKPLKVSDIGLLYEDDTWGSNIYKEFDKLNQIKRISSKPIRSSDKNDEVKLMNTIEFFYHSDIKVVVICLLNDETIIQILKELKKFNKGLFAKYRPTIILYKSDKLDKFSPELFTGGKVFGITVLRNLEDQLQPEIIANSLDAIYLTNEFSVKHKNITSFKTSFSSFYEGDSDDLDIDTNQFLTNSFYEKSFNKDESRIKIYTINTKAGSLVTKAKVDFSDDAVYYFFQTSLIPFFNFYILSKHPIIFIIFGIIAFISFATFIHIEYYIPYGLLLKSMPFWVCFAVYLMLTFTALFTLLYLNIIKSSQIIVIIGFSVICPVILNFLIKYLSNIKMPVISSYVQDFFERLRISIELSLEKVLPINNFEKLVNSIKTNTRINRIRVLVYGLIIDLHSNGLTKKFGNDLKNKINSINILVEKIDGKDASIQEDIRKEELVKFYVKLLYFSSNGIKQFKDKLLNQGLLKSEDVNTVFSKNIS